MTRAATALVVCGALLSACGGGEDEATAGNPPPGGNTPPTISGTPQTTVLQGEAYAFTPNGSDADGNSLTYSVANRPGWAAFDASTGRLSGTPSSGDVGTYSNIQITVSDGTASATLTAFNIQVTALATGSATLTWTAPSQNTDGSALTNLSSYKIYWSRSAGSYPNSATVGVGIATYVVDSLTPGTWYFTITAVNAAGIESSYANVVSKTL
jgi:hypothetical protein